VSSRSFSRAGFKANTCRLRFFGTPAVGLVSATGEPLLRPTPTGLLPSAQLPQAPPAERGVDGPSSGPASSLSRVAHDSDRSIRVGDGR
jgi:hypothetical protein